MFFKLQSCSRPLRNAWISILIARIRTSQTGSLCVMQHAGEISFQKSVFCPGKILGGEGMVEMC